MEMALADNLYDPFLQTWATKEAAEEYERDEVCQGKCTPKCPQYKP